jgi:hypothetical protein
MCFPLDESGGTFTRRGVVAHPGARRRASGHSRVLIPRVSHCSAADPRNRGYPDSRESLTRGTTMPEVGLELYSSPCTYWEPPEHAETGPVRPRYDPAQDPKSGHCPRWQKGLSAAVLDGTAPPLGKRSFSCPMESWTATGAPLTNNQAPRSEDTVMVLPRNSWPSHHECQSDEFRRPRTISNPSHR